nr:venom protein [Lampona murina]
MKIILMFSFVGVVFCANLQAEEKDVAVVPGQDEQERYYYDGCSKTNEFCWTTCYCCYANGVCMSDFRCHYDTSPNFCDEKKERCDSWNTKNPGYKCDAF